MKTSHPIIRSSKFMNVVELSSLGFVHWLSVERCNDTCQVEEKLDTQKQQITAHNHSLISVNMKLCS